MKSTARIAGAFYLLNIVSGASALFLLQRHNDLYGKPVLAVASLSYVIVTLLLYSLFKDVNRILSLIAAVFSLIGCAAGAINDLGIVRMPVNALAFFGVYCILIGVLMLRSTFAPRFPAVLMLIGGAGWLTFAFPALARILAPYNMLPGVIAETVLTGWLLFFGPRELAWT